MFLILMLVYTAVNDFKFIWIFVFDHSDDFCREIFVVFVCSIKLQSYI